MIDKFDNDFGFSAITEDELEIVQTAKSQVEKGSDKAKQMYDAIRPLLDNLRKDPDKPIINWPNRLEKIDAFEKKLLTILNK